MPHSKSDFTVADAIAGGRVIYAKLSGDTVANDALFYAVLDVLGYGGTYIPSEATAKLATKKPMTAAAAKKKLLTALKPLVEAENAQSAAAFDWRTIAALVLQLLPYLLPLLG